MISRPRAAHKRWNHDRQQRPNNPTSLPVTRRPSLPPALRPRLRPGQVRGVLWELFTLIPTPEAALHAPEEAVLAVIRPLGQFYRAGCAPTLPAAQAPWPPAPASGRLWGDTGARLGGVVRGGDHRRRP